MTADFDFGAYPPEFNAGRLYAGPGSAPMMTAASRWSGLASEFTVAARDYEAVVTQLSDEQWLGPVSITMAYAATLFVAWMRGTAILAEQTANQARAAAAAYETAVASMPPPPAITANRTQLKQARATNALNQNAAQITHLETEYALFWSQAAATMYTYAGTSSAAATLSPFVPPPPIVNPTGVATQAATVSQAADNGSVQQTLNHTLSAIPSALHSLTAPVIGSLREEGASLGSASNSLTWLWETLFGTSTFPGSLQALLAAYAPCATVLYNTEGLPYFSIGMANNFVQSAKTLGLVGGTASTAAGEAAKGLGALGTTLGSSEPIAAGLGNAASVGKLSVPPVWSGPLSGIHPGTAPLPVSTITAAPETRTGNLLGGMPLAGLSADTAGSGPRYGFRPTVMARPPSAG